MSRTGFERWSLGASTKTWLTCGGLEVLHPAAHGRGSHIAHGLYMVWDEIHATFGSKSFYPIPSLRALGLHKLLNNWWENHMNQWCHQVKLKYSFGFFFQETPEDRTTHSNFGTLWRLCVQWTAASLQSYSQVACKWHANCSGEIDLNHFICVFFNPTQRLHVELLDITSSVRKPVDVFLFPELWHVNSMSACQWVFYILSHGP